MSKIERDEQDPATIEAVIGPTKIDTQIDLVSMKI